MTQSPDADKSAESTTLIRCMPMGICANDYELSGAGHRASVLFDAIGEEGVLTVDGTAFEVLRSGLMSGEWTLRRDGEKVASAQKRSAFGRDFMIHCPMGVMTLVAGPRSGYDYQLARYGDVVAIIAPVHALTTRATIEIFPRSFDFQSLSFAFWMAALMWRRKTRRGNGS